MARNNQNEKLLTDINEIRKELDAKIEGKLPSAFFYLATTIFIAVMGSMFLFFDSKNDKINEKIEDLTTRITVIETKMPNDKK